MCQFDINVSRYCLKELTKNHTMRNELEINHKPSLSSSSSSFASGVSKRLVLCKAVYSYLTTVI